MSPRFPKPLSLATLAFVALAGCDAGGKAPVDPSIAEPEVALVTDRTELLGAEAEERIAAYLQFVRSEYDIDYRVLLDESGAVGRSAEIFENLSIGDRQTGRGLLLVIDPSGEQVRVEVGYALEPFVTDLAASSMIGDYLAPHYRSGDLQASIEAAVEALIDEVRPALPELEAEKNRPRLAGSGGAGAGVDLLRDLPVGEMSADAEATLQRVLVPQADPRSTRDLELAMMHQGFYYQQASIYDPAWRAASRPGTWPAARLQEIARQWDRPYEVEVQERWAIAYYTDAPDLGPTLLQRESEGWLIDATSGARHIVYDYSNASWYAIDGDYPQLALLQRVFDLGRVKLQDGRRAWMLRSP
jgi:uncharacterized protein